MRLGHSLPISCARSPHCPIFPYFLFRPAIHGVPQLLNQKVQPVPNLRNDRCSLTCPALRIAAEASAHARCRQGRDLETLIVD